MLGWKDHAARVMNRTALPFVVVAILLGPALVRAEPPSFDDFFRQVSECQLDLSRYEALIHPTRDGVLITLPSAGALRGFLIDSFYVATGPLGADEYGLLINGPVDAVARAFPELAARQTVNGHLRRLASLAEQSRERGAARKTLLVCSGGTRV
jgi:hypothetical protein